MHQNESLNLLTGKEEPPLEISTITAFLYVWIYIYTEVLLGSLIVCKWSGQLKNVKIDNMMISIPSFRNILKITRKKTLFPMFVILIVVTIPKATQPHVLQAKNLIFHRQAILSLRLDHVLCYTIMLFQLEKE